MHNTADILCSKYVYFSPTSYKPIGNTYNKWTEIMNRQLKYKTQIENKKRTYAQFHLKYKK